MANLTVNIVKMSNVTSERTMSPKREFLIYLLEEYGNDPKISDYANAEIKRMNDKNIQRAEQRKAYTERIIANVVTILHNSLKSGDAVTPLSVRNWFDEDGNIMTNGKRIVTMPKIQKALEFLVENGEMTTSIEYVRTNSGRIAKQKVYKFN